MERKVGFMKRLFLGAVLVSFLTGCATMGTGRQATDTEGGALLGALAGGIIGNQTGSPLTGAAIGAGIGGLAGNAVGGQN